MLLTSVIVFIYVFGVFSRDDRYSCDIERVQQNMVIGDLGKLLDLIAQKARLDVCI